MKIINEDEKEGIVELLPETLDDLWHLSHIIEVGDNASSKTTRRIQDNTGDKLRSDRGVKKHFIWVWTLKASVFICSPEN